MKEVKDIRLVVVDEKPESAESISRIMRDAGQLMPVQWANSPLRLENLINDASTPVVLANASLPWYPFDQICQTTQQYGLVTIALGATPDTSLELRVLRQGAICLANPEHPALLEQQVQLALQLCGLKNEIQRKQSQLDSLDTRCDALLDTAAEPIAYTSEGVITSANSAFATLVGADNSADLSGRLISDFIAAESLYDFSRELRRLMRDESNHVQMDNALIASLQGHNSSAIVFMHNVEINGEHSIQILIREQAAGQQAASSTAATSTRQQRGFEKALPNKIKTTPDALPSLAIVHDQSSYEPAEPVPLKAPLDRNNINGMMARLSAWEAQTGGPASKSISDSANDAYSVEALPQLLQKQSARVEAQPLLSLHSDNNMVLTRIKSDDRLMPISQMLVQPLDGESATWLLEQANQLALPEQWVLAPVSQGLISASCIEQLQTLNASKQLVLGLSEEALHNDFHGSNQFLLQLQKIGMKAALWSNSPASVLADCLSDLANSVRSGIHCVVLDASHSPTLSQEQADSSWSRLLSLCHSNNIALIVQRPEDEASLQTWWRLGIGWCMTESQVTINKFQQTGTTAK